MERNAVQFRYCGKERESFPVLTGRKGKEMLSEKNGEVNMYVKIHDMQGHYSRSLFNFKQFKLQQVNLLLTLLIKSQ